MLHSVLLPVQDQIQRLHIDCNWVEQELKETEQNAGELQLLSLMISTSWRKLRMAAAYQTRKAAEESMVGRQIQPPLGHIRPDMKVTGRI